MHRWECKVLKAIRDNPDNPRPSTSTNTSNTDLRRALQRLGVAKKPRNAPRAASPKNTTTSVQIAGRGVTADEGCVRRDIMSGARQHPLIGEQEDLRRIEKEVFTTAILPVNHGRFRRGSNCYCLPNWTEITQRTVKSTHNRPLLNVFTTGISHTISHLCKDIYIYSETTTQMV